MSLPALVDGGEDALVDPEGHGGGQQRQRQVAAHRQERHVLRDQAVSHNRSHGLWECL